MAKHEISLWEKACRRKFGMIESSHFFYLFYSTFQATTRSALLSNFSATRWVIENAVKRIAIEHQGMYSKSTRGFEVGTAR
jgi:hypothetical protein